MPKSICWCPGSIFGVRVFLECFKNYQEKPGTQHYSREMMRVFFFGYGKLKILEGLVELVYCSIKFRLCWFIFAKFRSYCGTFQEHFGHRLKLSVLDVSKATN